MAPSQAPLDRVFAAHRAYLDAEQEADRLRAERDALVLEATDAGATRATLAAALGLTRGRVQQLVERARTARL